METKGWLAIIIGSSAMLIASILVVVGLFKDEWAFITAGVSLVSMALGAVITDYFRTKEIKSLQEKVRRLGRLNQSQS